MDRDEFLDITKQIESSGGKDYNHSTITDPKSVHFGDHAVGAYGLMPKTIEELGRRVKDPQIQALTKMSNDEQNEYLKENKDVDDHLANTLFEHIHNKIGDDPQIENYAWQNGHNLTADKITDKRLNNSDRTDKFNKLASVMNKNTTPAEQPQMPQSPTLSFPMPGPAPQPVLPQETTPEPQASPMAQKIPEAPTKDPNDILNNNPFTNNELINNQRKFQRLFPQQIRG